ncbi:MAG: TetR/AcrR family transcriptional regulator [Rhodoluna sp.]
MPKKNLSNASEYAAADWLGLGPVAEPSTREKMIMLAIEDIRDVGPADFSPMRVCDRLGLKHPLVNYHFGNRDGLIAEATWWAYQLWSKNVVDSIQKAPANPEKRLRAFVVEEAKWATRFEGMYLLLQHPLASFDSQILVKERYQKEMEELFDYHLALVAVCVADLRSGKVSSVDFDKDNLPRTLSLTNPGAVLTAGHIAWMTHGFASWSAGHHVSTKSMDARAVKNLSVGFAKKTYVDLIVKVAKGN